MQTRALVLVFVALGLASLSATGCGSDSGENSAAHSQPTVPSATAKAGRLTARPHIQVDAVPADVSGVRPIGPAGRALLYIPAGRPATWLVVVLHGARGAPGDAIGLFEPLADDARLMLLAPRSHGYTWDVGIGGFGPDVAAISRLLEEIFVRYRVDPKHVAVAGFSDGGSYALSLGLTNGDLFKAVVAFSPVFAAPSTPHGSPRIFVTHGTEDSIVRIGQTSRRIVPRLRSRGYSVRYKEFHGEHAVPPRLAREAVEWLLAGSP